MLMKREHRIMMFQLSKGKKINISLPRKKRCTFVVRVVDIFYGNIKFILAD